MEISGWPKGVEIDRNLKSRVATKILERGILTGKDGDFLVSGQGIQDALKMREAFERMRERFEKSISLRVKRDFADLNDAQVSKLASDIDLSLVDYFRECGLTIASIIFSKGFKRILPHSLFAFITSASTRYDDMTMRQAFFKASVDCFVHAESIEIEYIGRISQGFFAFHGLGVFGDEAKERLNLASSTVWLVDSDSQLRLLALGSSGNSLYRDCIKRLKKIGLRFFTTSSLSNEIRVHLWFADNVIKTHGQSSIEVSAAAKGETPYYKPNLFMEGFVNWQAAGNPCNWKSYLFNIFGKYDYMDIDFKDTLGTLGIEVIDLEIWPGFVELHYAEVEEYKNKIVSRLQPYVETEIENETGKGFDPDRKAKPEAEAYNIVKKERDGIYYILSEQNRKHSAWFISHTSMLNLLENGVVITWQPESFLSYASTLCEMTDADSTKQAFERIVLGLAQSGMSLLDDTTIAQVFGAVIEQSRLDIQELREEYNELLKAKYGESMDSVLARLPVQYYPTGVRQITAEIAQNEAERRRAAEMVSASKDEKIRELERELKPLAKYKAKLIRRQSNKKKTKKKNR